MHGLSILLLPPARLAAVAFPGLHVLDEVPPPGCMWAAAAAAARLKRDVSRVGGLGVAGLERDAWLMRLRGGDTADACEACEAFELPNELP